MVTSILLGPNASLRLPDDFRGEADDEETPISSDDLAASGAGGCYAAESFAEKQRHLIPLDEAISHMDELVGLFLTHLSGLLTRCGGRDLAVRRAIGKAVFEMRVEISEACTKLADQSGEFPLDDGA